MSKLSDVLKKIVGHVAPFAPVVATALGGPGAGAAVKLLSRKLLGKDNGTESEVEAALANATPEQLLALKQADYDFEIDQQRIAAEDRASARNREIQAHDSWTPRILAGIVVLSVLAGEGYAMTHAIPAGAEILVGRVLGTLDAALMCVLYYYFGSSAGSAHKNTIMRAK